MNDFVVLILDCAWSWGPPFEGLCDYLWTVPVRPLRFPQSSGEMSVCVCVCVNLLAKYS